jgi:hypothetical protein
MSPSRPAKTLADGLAADPFSCDVLASLHPHREQKGDPQSVVEIRDS